MEMLPLLSAAAVLAGIVAAGVLWLLIRTSPRCEAADGPDASRGRKSEFLLDGGRVVDSDDNRSVPSLDGPPRIETWLDLRDWLGPRFSDLPEVLPPIARSQTQRFRSCAPGDHGEIDITARGSRHLVVLHEPDPPTPARWHAALRALSEQQPFTAAAESAPVAICIRDASGPIRWKNPLFATLTDPEAEAILNAAGGPDGQAAHPVRIGGRSFEVTAITTLALCVVYAVETTRMVQADAMRNSFIQTLTKTFADLATGLVVFDRTRRLVLFNPALVDLTGLSTAFLSDRPALLDFFDQLRNRQVLPEPRDYASWRGQIDEMIETAAEGHYCETWTLPTGLTYRVTGRPHPDGAVAFLIEDITDEVSLTRRSRSQLEMRQAVLDRLDEAIAVFGPDGVIAFCNRRFGALLGFDPDSRFADTTFDDIVAAGWGELAGHAGGVPRQRTETILRATPAGPAHGRVEPLPDGFVMLSLTPLKAVEPA